MNAALIVFAISTNGAQGLAAYPLTDAGIAACEIHATALQARCLPACPTEDSANCYWTSRYGDSFIDVGGNVIYFANEKGI